MGAQQTRLSSALASVEKQYGGRVRLQGKAEEVRVIPTGSLSLDRAMGVGGYPRGRIVEIYGEESSGKTTLALHAIAETQKRGGTAAYVDAEHAFDAGYAESLGVNLEDLIIIEPGAGEEAFEVLNVLLETGGLDIVVVDSVAGLCPKGELEGTVSEEDYGAAARMMSSALRKFAGNVKRHNAVALFTNQMRSKKVSDDEYKLSAAGGNALKFYASLRLEIKPQSKIKEGGEDIGDRCDIVTIKNKVGTPMKVARVDLVYGVGMDRVGDLVDVAVEEGVLATADGEYAFGNTNLGSCRLEVINLLGKDIELRDSIARQTRTAIGRAEPPKRPRYL